MAQLRNNSLVGGSKEMWQEKKIEYSPWDLRTMRILA